MASDKKNRTVWVLKDKFGKQNRLMSYDDYLAKSKSSSYGIDYVFWDEIRRENPFEKMETRNYINHDQSGKKILDITSGLKQLEGMSVYCTVTPGWEYTVEQVDSKEEVTISRPARPHRRIHVRVHSKHLVPTPEWWLKLRATDHPNIIEWEEHTERPDRQGILDAITDESGVPHCPHCTVEFPEPYYSYKWRQLSCNVCDLPLGTCKSKQTDIPVTKPDQDLSKALEESLKDQTRPPNDAESDKIMLARERLLQLADVVQERLVSDEFANDPAEHFIRLRSSELDLQTCWEILQKFDANALEWLNTTRAWGLVMERFAVEPEPKL